MPAVTVTCPSCGFSREVPDRHIPAGETTVTCPQCSHRFSFSKDTGEFVFGTAPETPAPDAAAFSYAGFWPRFAAYSIDILLLCAALLALLAVSGVGDDIEALISDPEEAIAGIEAITKLFAVLVVMAVVSVAYFVVSWTRWGRTAGMKTLGIRVIAADGGPVTARRAFVRWLTGYFLPGVIPYLSVFVYLALAIMVAVSEKKQGWHDRAAGTFVVHD